VVVELCHGCPIHQLTTRHKEDRYQRAYALVAEAAGEFALPCESLRLQGKHLRIGACEVYLLVPGSKTIVLHSKLASLKWPSSSSVGQRLKSSMGLHEDERCLLKFDIDFRKVRADEVCSAFCSGLLSSLALALQVEPSRFELIPPLLPGSTFAMVEVKARVGCGPPMELIDQIIAMHERKDATLLSRNPFDKLIAVFKVGMRGPIEELTAIEEEKLRKARPSVQRISEIEEGMLSLAREGAFQAMVKSLQVEDCVGGADAKHREELASLLRQESVHATAVAFVRTVERMWHDKGGGIIEELCRNCRTEVDEQSHKAVTIDQVLLSRMSIALQQKYGDGLLFKDSRVMDAPVAIVVMLLYTMQDVDIDRTLLFSDCPVLNGGEESPEARDRVFKPYREQHVKDERNPQMFSDGCWSTRASWDAFAGQRENKDAQEKLQKWVKWVCLLAALRQKLVPPVRVTRGLTQLPDFIMQELMAKQPGDLIFWAAMSSTTLDGSISESYANQMRPVNRNVIFTIDGVDEGTPLYEISQYPKEQEVLLPAFSMLKVKAIEPSLKEDEPARLACDFAGVLMPEVLQFACEQDLRRAMAQLWTAGEEEAARKERQAKEEAERKAKEEAERKAKAAKEEAARQEATDALLSAGLTQKQIDKFTFCTTLIWHAHVDVDLAVHTPSGKIDYTTKQVGPFSLDIDDLGEQHKVHVENISCSEPLPLGKYRIVVFQSVADWEVILYIKSMRAGGANIVRKFRGSENNSNVASFQVRADGVTFD
jgi:hypothetical protein